jgi:uncharacterized protein (DUF58 family)
MGAVGLFAFAAVTHAVWPQILGCALVGLIASSLIAVIRPLPIGVAVELPERLVVGRPFETTLRVTHRGSGVSRPLIVRHRFLRGQGKVPTYATMVGTLAGHEEVVVRAGRTPRARGRIEASQLEIDAVAPFGFFTRRTVIAVARPVVVLPASAPALAVAQVAGVRSGAVGTTNGLDAGAVREWRPGDQVRNVQWRSTARTGRLTVIEREEQSAGVLVVVVVGKTGDAAFETTLATVSATAATAVRQGQPVLVVTSTAEISCARERTESALLEFFACIEKADPFNDALIAQVLRTAGRGGTVMLAAGPTMPSTWRAHLGTYALRAGVRIVDIAAVNVT